MRNLLLLAITLVWSASATPGVFYRVKENVNGSWVKVSDVPSLQLTFSPKRGTHTYAVWAVKDGMESLPSNSVSVRIKR